ncbi:hypothetical protein [Natrinema soli]|uniref:Uncharacterized protein n=1 Tax=Natrinema soli TaxID=1930624 RepID=A0ABD5SQ56_9EURY|nr:hypothetical protein [Natrinema soli]
MNLIERATAVTNSLWIGPGTGMGEHASAVRIERPSGGDETR